MSSLSVRRTTSESRRPREFVSESKRKKEHLGAKPTVEFQTLQINKIGLRLNNLSEVLSNLILARLHQTEMDILIPPFICLVSKKTCQKTYNLETSIFLPSQIKASDADGHEYHTNVMMNGAQIKVYA